MRLLVLFTFVSRVYSFSIVCSMAFLFIHLFLTCGESPTWDGWWSWHNLWYISLSWPDCWRSNPFINFSLSALKLPDPKSNLNFKQILSLRRRLVQKSLWSKCWPHPSGHLSIINAMPCPGHSPRSKQEIASGIDPPARGRPWSSLSHFPFSTAPSHLN